MAAKKKKKITTKLCARCREKKDLEEFGKNPKMKLGRKSYCRVCSAELQKLWNRKHRAEAKEDPLG
jgi:hypothetical protein